MKVVFNSLFLDEQLRTVKLASLYCDEVILPDAEGGRAGNVTPISKEVTEISTGGEVWFDLLASFNTVPNSIKEELSPLIQEGIIRLSKEKGLKTDVFIETLEDIKDHLYFRNPEDGKLTNRFHELAAVALGKSKCVEYDEEVFGEGYYSQYNLVTDYFAYLADVVLSASFHNNSPIFTDSIVINELLTHYLSKERLSTRYNLSTSNATFLAQQVLQEFLPNIKDAPVEEILEVRLKLRDELEAFKVAMSKLSTEISPNAWDSDVENDIDKLIETRIKPSVYELKRSLKLSKHKAVQRVFENLKDPSTYVPLVGTVLSGMHPSIALLSSMGLAGFKAIYDTLVEYQTERDANGLVFLLKAPKRFRNS